MDSVRVSSKDGFPVPSDANSTETLVEARYAIWALCAWDIDSVKKCHPLSDQMPFSMKASGPLATASIFGALATSLSTHPAVNGWASLLGAISASLVLFSFFYAQVWLYSSIRNLFSRGVHGYPQDHALVSAGPGLWTGLVVLALVATASMLSCMRHRRHRLATEAGYPMVA